MPYPILLFSPLQLLTQPDELPLHRAKVARGKKKKKAYVQNKTRKR